MPQGGAGATIDVPQVPKGVPIDLAAIGAYSGGTTFDIPQGDTVNITASPLTLEPATFSGGTIFDVGEGAVVKAIMAGTFQGGASFSVDQSATVDLTGGQAVSYGGTLTGTGEGTVQFSSGAPIPSPEG